MAQAKAKIEARAQDQINLTDEESRIMPVSGGGFEQSYNAQAAVDRDSMLVMAPAVTQACNDKEQVEPMLAQLDALPQSLGKADTLLANTGYFSTTNVAACEQAGIDLHIAVKRESHHQPPLERFAEPMPPVAGSSPAERMSHKLQTQAGRTAYALRKQTVEPVCPQNPKMTDYLSPIGYGIVELHRLLIDFQVQAFTVSQPLRWAFGDYVVY